MIHRVANVQHFVSIFLIECVYKNKRLIDCTRCSLIANYSYEIKRCASHCFGDKTDAEQQQDALKF
jgi:hypothetical protein